MPQVPFLEEPLGEVQEGLLDVDVCPGFGDGQQAKMRNAINTLHPFKVEGLGLRHIA